MSLTNFPKVRKISHCVRRPKLTSLQASVHAVDMFPQPNTWVPPNCFLEVEDVTKEWTWREKFDLVHIRYLIGSFTPQEWNDLYKQAVSTCTE